MTSRFITSRLWKWRGRHSRAKKGKTGEDVRFVDSHIVNIASPVEVIEAAQAIKEFHATPVQFNALVETYSRALENVAKDNRSFWFEIR